MTQQGGEGMQQAAAEWSAIPEGQGDIRIGPRGLCISGTGTKTLIDDLARA